MNDNTLRKNVLDELEFEPSLNAADVGVAVHAGVVTLTGHVSSYAQKLAAERAAWRVKGVKALAQHIEVRVPWDGRCSDDEIAARALNVLAWNSLIPNDAIHIKVADGWVTLGGEVEWNYQRNAVESEVRKLAGVVGITNDITIGLKAHAVDIKQHIMNALKRHAEIKAEHIRIDVKGNTVDIDGEVDDWNERQAIERAVWSSTGVREVNDRLRIR